MIDFLKKGTFGVNLLFFNFQTEWDRNIANRINYSFAQVDHPINVYISSTGNRYLLQFCNKLKEEIDKTRIAHTYVADTVKAGTLRVKDTNKTELASADVCIAIIDNNTGVSEEFLKYEYPYIKQNGIRTFFYFCGLKKII
jgi:hypothetical protein